MIRKHSGISTARNPGQQWRTAFDGKGFTVTPDHGGWIWGLELTRIVVNDQSARYPITIDPIAQQAYLKASNTGANDKMVQHGRNRPISKQHDSRVWCGLRVHPK